MNLIRRIAVPLLVLASLPVAFVLMSSPEGVGSAAPGASGSAASSSSARPRPWGSGSASAVGSGRAPATHWLSHCTLDEAGRVAKLATTGSYACPAGASAKASESSGVKTSSCVRADGRKEGLEITLVGGAVRRADLYESGDLVRIVKLHPNGRPSVIREFERSEVHCTRFWKDDGSQDPGGVWGP
jgi:hypothetical protein